MTQQNPPINLAPTAKNKDDMITPQVSLSASNGVIEAIKIPLSEQQTDMERQKTVEGEAYFHRLGWKRMTVILIVQAIALGALGLPKSFSQLGMVLGVILCIGVGLVALYGSILLAQVQLKFPEVNHYVDIGRLMFGPFGTKLFGVFFVCSTVMGVGSHCLTGAIAFSTITESSICSLAFAVVTAVAMFLLAIPPSFAEIAILGYIDFASIILAIGITIVGTGVRSSSDEYAQSSIPWSPWPKEGLTLSEAFVAINNIVFAYGFAIAQPSFMSEMHTPGDFFKSARALATIEIIVYTLTGSLIYVFVGQGIQSPALLSTGPFLSRVAFGVAMPVILISGSINITVICRYIHGRYYRDSIIRFVNTSKGWITWIILVFVVTLLAWIIAEAIPFFSELLSISATLFLSGLSFYFPALMWFMLLREGKWHSKKNLPSAIGASFLFLFGVVILGCGLYSSINETIQAFGSGSVSKPFMCSRG